MDVTLSKIGDKGCTSYVPHPINQTSILNIKNTNDNYCAICSISARLYRTATKVSLPISYTQNFISKI